MSAYAETPHTGDLDLTAGWTVEAWIRDYHPGGFNHRRARILTKGDTTGPEVPYFIGIESNGLFAGLRTGGTPFVVRYDLATNRVNPASWHHVAATLNASAGILTLYLDGVVVASAPVSARSLGNTGPLSIGRSGPASNDYWKGKIDDVRIWNVARNASEIAASFRTELVGPQTGLAANWRFNEGSGFTAIDSAGGHLAVLNGGALFSAEVHP